LTTLRPGIRGGVTTLAAIKLEKLQAELVGSDVGRKVTLPQG
jgi:hypothetical protein